jgi:hypothetical protein
MNLKDRIYITLSKIAPLKYREHFGKQLICAGEQSTVEQWIGTTTAIGLLLSIVVAIIPVSLFREFDILYILLAVGAFLFTHFVAYLIAYFKAEDRRKKVDEALPDMLQLIAANLRAGMTPFQALKLSARDEFGPLKDEVECATSKALGVASFSAALLSISKSVKSDTLDRSMKLFTTAMRSGGHLAQLLEELSNDISTSMELKRELITNTKTYTMFIMFTIVIGAPLLLAIAINFLGIVTELQQETSASTVGFGLSFLAGEIEITTGFLNKISLVLIGVTVTLASMLLGVIAEGKIKYGFRYIPFLLIGAFIMFFVAKYLVGNYLLGMA